MTYDLSSSIFFIGQNIIMIIKLLFRRNELTYECWSWRVYSFVNSSVAFFRVAYVPKDINNIFVGTEFSTAIIVRRYNGS